MNVEDVKKATIEMERAILSMLMEFEEATGCIVEEVTLVKAQGLGPSPVFIDHVRVTVMLP